MTNTKNIEAIIKELKSFTELQEQLKAEIEALKEEAIAYMTEHGIDEVVTDDGKITYREVISRRFASTEFKKDFLDVYEAYTRLTKAMRFTFN